MKHKSTVFLLLFFSFVYANAQVSTTWKDIKGVVYEEIDTTSVFVENAIVRLLNPNDSTVIRYTSTNKNGLFSFPSTEKRDYLLSIAFIGYNTFYKNITPYSFQGESINLGEILLEESSLLLSEVTILGEVPELVVKEDTLEYNVAAFRMQESAVVEDLLKRLPGIEVEADGKITTTQGKAVPKVFVDGKEFFGKDPKVATKNITVDILDKVQVIEKKSDQELLTGVEDGEEEIIINLTIKKGMKKGWLGNATAGVGDFTDAERNDGARYAGNLFISRFLENDQITLVANSNNINNQAFADDGNQARSNMRGRGGGGGGNGLTSSSMAGLNVVGIVNDQLKMGGNIRYNYSDELVDRKSFRQNFMKDSVSYLESLSSDHGYSNNLVFDYKTEYNPDSLNAFVLTTGISYNNSRSIDHSYQSTLAGDEDSTRVNYSDAYTRLHSDGLTVNAELAYSRKFQRKGRRFSLTGTFNMNHNSGEGTNNSVNESFLNPSLNEYLDQESQNTSDRNSYGIRMTYVEPVWKTNNTLQFSYNLRYNHTDNVRETFDYDPETQTYSVLNSDYSKSLWNNFLTQTFGLNFNAVHAKYTYNIGLNVVPSHTQSTRYVKNGDIHGNDSILSEIPGRNVVNFSPQLSYTQRFTKEMNLRFTYRGNASQPSVSQLDPTPNNTNSMNIRYGNPDLLPSFSHNLSLRFNKNQREAQRALTSNLSFSFVQNQIINFTVYEDEDSIGIQTTVPINENGSWNASADLMYSMPLDAKKKFKFSTQTRFGYNNRIGYVMVNKQSERNISGTFSASENIGLSYSKDWFYGQFRGNIRYSNTSNSLEGRQDQSDTNFGLTYNTQLFFPYNWTFASDINYRGRRGLSAGYNTDEVVWNAEISKQFMSRKQATVRVKWNDILQQTLNINRTINANYIEDNEYNILSSYFLVSFAYRFNQMGNRRGSGERRANREDGDNVRSNSEYSPRQGQSRGGDGGGSRRR